MAVPCWYPGRSGFPTKAAAPWPRLPARMPAGVCRLRIAIYGADACRVKLCPHRPVAFEALMEGLARVQLGRQQPKGEVEARAGHPAAGGPVHAGQCCWGWVGPSAADRHGQRSRQVTLPNGCPGLALWVLKRKLRVAPRLNERSAALGSSQVHSSACQPIRSSRPVEIDQHRVGKHKPANALAAHRKSERGDQGLGDLAVHRCRC